MKNNIISIDLNKIYNKIDLEHNTYSDKITKSDLNNLILSHYNLDTFNFTLDIEQFKDHFISKFNMDHNDLILLDKTTYINSYLDKHDKNVLDKTPFEEFIIKCIGIAHDPIREARLTMKKKYKKGMKPNFRYEPSDNLSDNPKKIPDFKFSNSSGNEIIK